MWNRLPPMTLVLLLAGASVAAEPAKPQFTDAYLYPTQGEVGMGFFTVTSPEDDAITAVSSDCCSAVEIHRSEKINGMMSMRKVESLNLSKRASLKAQPNEKGGLHLMLIGIKNPPVKEGDALDMAFTFKNSGAETVHFVVKPRP